MSFGGDIGDRGVGNFGAAVFFNGGKHAPAFVLEGGVASDAVENEHRFNCFRSVRVVSIKSWSVSKRGE